MATLPLQAAWLPDRPIPATTSTHTRYQEARLNNHAQKQDYDETEVLAGLRARGDDALRRETSRMDNTHTPSTHMSTHR